MRLRMTIGLLSALGLLTVFLTQRYDWSALGSDQMHHVGKFIFNRTIRFFFNDFFAIGLIYALFKERKFVLFAIGVQIFGLLFILIPYFVIKLHAPNYNGPLLNFIHRLVLNPLLVLLLIPAFYYQKLKDTHF